MRQKFGRLRWGTGLADWDVPRLRRNMDVYDSATRSRVMRSIRSKDTNPGLVVRSFLHEYGFRFRLNRTDLPGSPDSTLPEYQTVILSTDVSGIGITVRTERRPIAIRVTGFRS